MTVEPGSRRGWRRRGPLSGVGSDRGGSGGKNRAVTHSWVVRATVSDGVLAAAWAPDLDRDAEPLDPLSTLLASSAQFRFLHPLRTAGS